MNYRFMKLRRVALVALSVVCTLSTTTAICANAASEKYTHTVSVNSGTGILVHPQTSQEPNTEQPAPKLRISHLRYTMAGRHLFRLITEN